MNINGNTNGAEARKPHDHFIVIDGVSVAGVAQEMLLPGGRSSEEWFDGVFVNSEDPESHTLFERYRTAINEKQAIETDQKAEIANLLRNTGGFDYRSVFTDTVDLVLCNRGVCAIIGSTAFTGIVTAVFAHTS